MNRHLGQSLLATLCHAQADHGANVLLLVSAQPEAGKATLCHLLQSMDAPSLTLLELEELETLEPGDISEGELIVIHGPALLHGEGLAHVPLRWISAVQGCVLVARRRRSRTKDLARVRALLDNAGLPILGVVLNTHRPRREFALMMRLRTWVARLRTRLRKRRVQEALA